MTVPEKSTNEIETWFANQREKLAITVEEIAMVDAREWKVIEENGKPHHIGLDSRLYHRGIFLKSFETARAKEIERFMIAPVAASEGDRNYGIALLARYDGRYLVQAKAEPGNGTSDHVVLTTTLQASYGNIARGLSGAVPFADLYHDKACVRFMVPQDGAQMYMKVNQVCVLNLSEPLISIPNNFIWATLEEILLLARQALVSEHVFQCLGIASLPNTES